MKEKHKIKYSCACWHEIALEEGVGFWKPTLEVHNCNKHK